MRLAELRKAVGGPPQTTLRGHLGNLIDIGAVEKRSRHGRPSKVDNALTPIGSELLLVAEVLEAWLARSSGRPLDLESEAGKAAVKALIGGWSSTMLRALAARPFSLTELDNLITALTYPALERRLSAMHMAGQVEAMPSGGKGTPYVITDWLRHSVAPLVTAARCERRHLRTGSVPLSRIDMETFLLLATPLVALPRGVSGSCQFVVEMGDEPGSRPIGVRLSIEQGTIVECTSMLEPRQASSVHGAVGAWLEALVTGKVERLRIEGDGQLARIAAGAFHDALFPHEAQAARASESA
jgi:DNA-binding HxlR family transcriptional regulator